LVLHEAIKGKLLEPAGTLVARSLVGNCVTSLDMPSCSMAVSMLDEEMKRLWDAAVHSSALRCLWREAAAEEPTWSSWPLRRPRRDHGQSPCASHAADNQVEHLRRILKSYARHY